MTGNFLKELGADQDWELDNQNGLMKFDEEACSYVTTLRGLTSHKRYEYLVSYWLLCFHFYGLFS